MSLMTSTAAPNSPEFQRNREAYEARIVDLHKRRTRALVGGPEKARLLHKKRKQLLPRERLAAVLDPGSPFLEFGQLAGDGLYEGVPPGGSIITGVGLVCGRACMLMIHDATVKGGTYYGITAKKHVRAQMFAWQHRLPCITMVQSGGANLPEQAHIFPDDGQFGSIFYNQIRMSAEGITQIATVHGPSTAGGAYLPALCDEAVIVRNQGAMFLAGPELVYAATKEEVDIETLGGGEMHSRISGVTDHLAENDGHAIAIVRGIVANLGTAAKQRWDVVPPLPPRHDPREIYGIVSADNRHPTDNREVLLRLIDDSDLQEFKPLYGDTMICGFARIKGFQIGILANNGVMPARHSAAVHGRCVGLHGRQSRGAAGHCQARRQVHDGHGLGQRAALHADHRRLVRGGLPGDVRAPVQAQRDDDVAYRPRRADGPRAGRHHPGPGAREHPPARGH